ncbi:hypothetical protein AVEN_64085-1 [Araneus ventricosus]|uniref:Transposase Tc1-like domain-containing protein n=1 Tax=Araneus ventricosus TaxID=182803 RepID=A0A4Y2K543_ARAVE|nr:hypothetical protein AVEN_64085-1 [Araneus ventricosus]
MRYVGGLLVCCKLAQNNLLLPELNVHRSVIHRLWNRYQRDQNASKRRGSGRRRIITTTDDRYLLQRARCRRALTAGVAAFCCCRKAHIPPNCVAQTA